jgi:rRNA maturation endonuclease Nob1
MALIQFVENYDDLSTDRGFQFKFYCDKCRNGYMSGFQASIVAPAAKFCPECGAKRAG